MLRLGLGHKSDFVLLCFVTNPLYISLLSHIDTCRNVWW